MMVLRRECCIEKGQRDFLVLDFGEEVFLGCARGLILKKRKNGVYWNREKGKWEKMG